MWCDQLRRVSQFCGVEVLTYVILDNHFHLLVRVPLPRKLSDRELVERYRALYPHRPKMVKEVEEKLQEGGAQAEDLRLRLHARMQDISQFLKELKQRFTVWFNAHHKLFGTIWDGRFKSILVEDNASVLRTVAAYIDLNPLRASLVKKPEAYRWCGMAAAHRGDPLAQAGIVSVMKSKDWSEAKLNHQRFVYEAGMRQVKDRAHATINPDDIGVEKTTPCLINKQKWLSEGWMIGSRDFVRRNFQDYVAKFTAGVSSNRFKEESLQEGVIALRGRGRGGFVSATETNVG
jgi:hypothetical protein